MAMLTKGFWLTIFSSCALVLSTATFADNATSEKQAAAKNQLAPHSLMVTAALQSAKAQVEGMQSQLDTVTNPVADESMSHLMVYQKELKDNIATAQAHQAELSQAIQAFPKYSQSKQYKNLVQAISEVQRREQKIPQFSQSAFLQNKQQAMNDLKDLKSKIDNAEKKALSFDHEINAQTHFG